MKANHKIAVVLLAGFLTINLFGKTKVTLGEALAKHYVKAKAVCKGGLELNYAVSNLLKDSLSILVPAGWRFNSDAGKNDYQDIFVAHEHLLMLSPRQVKSFSIKGYCCEATKSGPVCGAPYTLGKMADSNLVKLGVYLNTHVLNDHNMEQYSVWAISNNESTASISGKNDSIAFALKTFVANIKHEPLPWYSMFKKATVSSGGTVSDQPLRFRSDLSIVVSKTCYSYCYLVDNKGNQVSEVFGKWLYPGSQQYNASFNLAGLTNGDYTLLIRSSEESFFEKVFRI